MTRAKVIEELANHILAIKRNHPVRVAIDGVDGAGKTTLADELAVPLQKDGREVIRASIDGFHRPEVERYQRGEDSPKGYYLDSFDYGALRSALLGPLGLGGNLLYRTAVYDHRADEAISDVPQLAYSDAILLFDGVFLLRPELYNDWEYRILVNTDFRIAAQRALERIFPGAPTTPERAKLEARYERRYIPGQKLYYERVRPQELADVIMDNDELANPKLSYPPGNRWSRPF